MSNATTIERDTDAEAHERQIAVYRGMTGERRLLIGMAMSDEAREVSLAGIRARHPGYDAEQARHALLRAVLGETLYRAAWPNRAPLQP